MFTVVIITLIASAVSASKDLTPNGEIAANSRLGMRLLSQAKVVQPVRQLNDEQGESDVTFIADYSIRYLGCHSLTQISNGESRNGNNQEQSVLYTESLPDLRYAQIQVTVANAKVAANTLRTWKPSLMPSPKQC